MHVKGPKKYGFKYTVKIELGYYGKRKYVMERRLELCNRFPGKL